MAPNGPTSGPKARAPGLPRLARPVVPAELGTSAQYAQRHPRDQPYEQEQRQGGQRPVDQPPERTAAEEAYGVGIPMPA